MPCATGLHADSNLVSSAARVVPGARSGACTRVVLSGPLRSSPATFVVSPGSAVATSRCVEPCERFFAVRSIWATLQPDAPRARPHVRITRPPYCPQIPGGSTAVFFATLTAELLPFLTAGDLEPSRAFFCFGEGWGEGTPGQNHGTWFHLACFVVTRAPCTPKRPKQGTLNRQ